MLLEKYNEVLDECEHWENAAQAAMDDYDMAYYEGRGESQKAMSDLHYSYFCETVFQELRPILKSIKKAISQKGGQYRCLRMRNST